MIKDNWQNGNLEEESYWRSDPVNPVIRWHVSYRYAKTFDGGTQIIEKDGWYWYAIDWRKPVQSSSGLVGPFPSASAAMADCETLHKQERRDTLAQYAAEMYGENE